MKRLHIKEEKSAIPSFQETVQYILDTPDSKSNDHFRSLTAVCSPCFFKYDAITKIESFDIDNKFIIDQIQASNLLDPNEHLHASGDERKKVLDEIPHKNTTWGLYDHFYSQLSEKMKTDLYERYKDDFDIFGYSFDKNDHPISLD